MKKKTNMQSYINYIRAIDNTDDNNSESFKIDETVGNVIKSTLIFYILYSIGFLINKEYSHAAYCFCIMLILCVLFLLLGKWTKKAIPEHKKKAILVFRIIGSCSFLVSLSLLLLIGIIMIGGAATDVARTIIIILFCIIIIIPISLIQINTCISKNNGIPKKSNLGQPPFWFAMIISSFFVHGLTGSGRYFALTIFLCILNSFFFYAGLIPNIVRLHLVNKYDLEDCVPQVFEDDEFEE